MQIPAKHVGSNKREKSLFEGIDRKRFCTFLKWHFANHFCIKSLKNNQFLIKVTESKYQGLRVCNSQ